MAQSQNGWHVDTTGAFQDRTGVGGVTFPNGVRRGDVATVLHYVAKRFDAEVEPLIAGTCWGWFVKNIEGSTSISNHASGTAIDLNAPAHPIGRRGTFTAAKAQAIRRILADCGGVVRWGGDYTGRPDEMHFEINKNATAVTALADRIRAEQEDDMTPADLDAVEKRVSDALAAFFFDATHAVRGDEIYQAADELAQRRMRTARDTIRAVTGGPVDQGVILAAIAASDGVDEAALATELIPGLSAAVVAGLPEGELDIADVEAAVRNVLRSGVGA